MRFGTLSYRRRPKAVHRLTLPGTLELEPRTLLSVEALPVSELHHFNVPPAAVGSPTELKTSSPLPMPTVPTPTPPPTSVKGVRFEPIEVKKTRERVLVITFSGALEPSSAQVVADYHLVTAGKDKKFGTRDDSRVRLASAIYDAGAHTVTLTPKRPVPKQKLQLTINTTATLDAQGLPIEGNNGQPGALFAVVFSGAGIIL